MKLQDVKYIALALFCAACSSCCGESDSSSGSTATTESGPSCACDCPDGPPATPKLDDFCAHPEHDGAACCRKLDGSEVGVCEGHECRATEQAQ